MGRLFEQRERAAEGIFVHDEEARFVARRRGIEKLAAWAGESMEFDETGRAAYRNRLVDAFIGGIHEDEIVAAVQRDIEHAGKPSLTGQVGLVLTQAIAEATLEAHPRPGGSYSPLRASDPASHLPKKPTFGWSL